MSTTGVSALGPPDFQGPECTDTTRRGDERFARQIAMASTRVSPLRPPGIVHHLSVPTGMLTLNPSRKIKVGRLCTREGSSQSASLRLTGLLHPLTRTHVRLLVRVSRRVEWGAHRPTPEHADAEARREARAADHDKAATPPLA
ncbi:hypothetical protein Bca101_102114 [Brassica carinata]